MIKLKAIKSREDTFYYLSFYLHCSFFWQLIIITSIISSGCWAKAKTSGHIVVPLGYLQPLNYWGLEVSKNIEISS